MSNEFEKKMIQRSLDFSLFCLLKSHQVAQSTDKLNRRMNERIKYTRKYKKKSWNYECLTRL